jgi:chemotaxis protein MotA
MDIATLIGLVGAIVMIIGSMIFAGGVSPFIDIASVVIVFGGTLFIVMMKMPMGVFIGHFKAMGKAFKPTTFNMPSIVERMVELAALARKDGMMALEGQQVPDRFFERGLQMLIDGADEGKLVKAMKQEIKAMKSRHDGNHSALKAWIDYGPAMGMIGTLIGLVLMLGNMSDPKSIGPAMAVALLTTLYGALIANVICSGRSWQSWKAIPPMKSLIAKWFWKDCARLRGATARAAFRTRWSPFCRPRSRRG